MPGLADAASSDPLAYSNTIGSLFGGLPFWQWLQHAHHRQIKQLRSIFMMNTRRLTILLMRKLKQNTIMKIND